MSIGFNIKIADQVVGISALFEETKRFCQDYITDETPVFSVAIVSEDIRYEQEKSDREAITEGKEPIRYSDQYLETLAVYRKIACGLLEHQILLFHGSVVAVDGVGYLFTAKSGTGKSTHAGLWRQIFSDRAIMINDDKPLLYITPEGVTAYGTPWDGKHHLSTNTSVPLKAICILARSDTNKIQRIDKRTAFAMLCQQSFRPTEPESLMQALTLINLLGDSVKLYRLECNMDPEAARTAYHGMNTD